MLGLLLDLFDSDVQGIDHTKVKNMVISQKLQRQEVNALGGL